MIGDEVGTAANGSMYTNDGMILINPLDPGSLRTLETKRLDAASFKGARGLLTFYSISIHNFEDTTRHEVFWRWAGVVSEQPREHEQPCSGWEAFGSRAVAWAF